MHACLFVVDLLCVLVLHTTRALLFTTNSPIIATESLP